MWVMSWLPPECWIMAAGHDGKPLDYQALERWTKVGFERGMKWRKGER
jgi:hypothetical protein